MERVIMDYDFHTFQDLAKKWHVIIYYSDEEAIPLKFNEEPNETVIQEKLDEILTARQDAIDNAEEIDLANTQAEIDSLTQQLDQLSTKTIELQASISLKKQPIGDIGKG